MLGVTAAFLVSGRGELEFGDEGAMGGVDVGAGLAAADLPLGAGEEVVDPGLSPADVIGAAVAGAGGSEGVAEGGGKVLAEDRAVVGGVEVAGEEDRPRGAGREGRAEVFELAAAV